LGNGTILILEKASVKKVDTIPEVSKYVSTIITNTSIIVCEDS
jgi:hypothetical protein